MPCRFVIVLAALVLTFAPARAASDDTTWTTEDKYLTDGGDRLMDESQFNAAESLYRTALDRHPHSSTALIDHVTALNALSRYGESLPEAQKAVDLDPTNARAYQCLGMTLALLHRNEDAVRALDKSLSIDPTDQTTKIWLAGTYYQTMQIARMGKTVPPYISFDDGQDVDDNARAQTAMRVADFFRQTGNGAAAIYWWQKSYDLGNTDATRFLVWAYDSGLPDFPYDDAAANYWSRRGPDAPFSWFPRLTHADEFVAWAHGWGIVLILLASAVVLPWMTLSLVAFFPARSLINEPTFPWMERARRAYPFMVLLSTSVLLLPLLDLANVIFYPSFLLPIPRPILIWPVFAVGFWSSNAVVVRWAWFYRQDAGTTAQNMKDIGITLLIYLPAFAIFISMAFILPFQFGWQAALMIATAIALYFYIQFGGWIRLARLTRLITPADPELVADAAELAQQRQLPAPSVWIIPWRKANALAFTFSNAIVVTEKLRTLLTRAEIKAVLAHELAHLCEDRVTKAMRLAMPLLLLPIFTSNLWSSSYILISLAGGYFLFMVGAMIMRKRARRMEERADSFGKEAESEAGLYPLALAKLYEDNLMPAVMPGKRKVHPHLYDRLLTAGITPDYPRPKPPGRWGGIAGLLVLALNVIAYFAIWLALF